MDTYCYIIIIIHEHQSIFMPTFWPWGARITHLNLSTCKYTKQLCLRITVITRKWNIWRRIYQEKSRSLFHHSLYTIIAVLRLCIMASMVLMCNTITSLHILINKEQWNRQLLAILRWNLKRNLRFWANLLICVYSYLFLIYRVIQAFLPPFIL